MVPRLTLTQQARPQAGGHVNHPRFPPYLAIHQVVGRSPPIANSLPIGNHRENHGHAAEPYNVKTAPGLGTDDSAEVVGREEQRLAAGAIDIGARPASRKLSVSVGRRPPDANSARARDVISRNRDALDTTAVALGRAGKRRRRGRRSDDQEARSAGRRETEHAYDKSDRSGPSIVRAPPLRTRQGIHRVMTLYRPLAGAWPAAHHEAGQPNGNVTSGP